MLDESRTGRRNPRGGDRPASTPSGPVLIRKSALAFRYRPRAASASHGPHFSEEYASPVPLGDLDLTPADTVERRKYFELTLEYGLQRPGAVRTSEPMPMVHRDTEAAGDDTVGNKCVSGE